MAATSLVCEIVAFHQSNAGDSLQLFRQCNLLNARRIAEWLGHDVIHTVRHNGKLALVMIAYPVSRTDYLAGGYPNTAKPGSDLAFVWSVCSIPALAGHVPDFVSILLRQKFPCVQFAFGYRNLRKTRIMKLKECVLCPVE